MSNSTHTERDQLLIDLFTTALEGGINYWSACSAYHWSHDDGSEDFVGFFADIIDITDDGYSGPVYVIDRKVISKGYRLATTTHRDTIGWSTEAPPLVITADTEWDFDASDADCIVQLGLFGDVKYG